MSSVSSPLPLPATATKMKLNPVRSKKKNHDINGVQDASRQVSSFFAILGRQIELLIDASPFGVEDPEPWTPETNPTFAALCDPVIALNGRVNSVKKNFEKKCEHGLFAAWALASQTFLTNFRKGLENAVEAEKKLGADVMVDDGVEQNCADAFVDLGVDKWGNSARMSHPWQESVAEAKVIKKQVKTAVSNFTMNKFLPFVDNLTLRANGIIVTSDDCSVECSIASLVDTISDEECPSIITDLTVKTAEVEQLLVPSPEGIKIEIDHSREERLEDNDTTSIDDEEFVMAEDEMISSEDEEFVDVLDDFDVTSVN